MVRTLSLLLSLAMLATLLSGCPTFTRRSTDEAAPPAPAAAAEGE